MARHQQLIAYGKVEIPTLRPLYADAPTDVAAWLDEVEGRVPSIFSKSTKWVMVDGKSTPVTTKYKETIATFDIETTSLTIDGDKFAAMYIWQLCVAECVIYGRTWDEYHALLDLLDFRLQLSATKTVLPIYIHNEGFEFSFIYRHFQWDDVFALDRHEPIRARTGCWEFRDSQAIFGCRLQDIELHDYDLHKAMGDLNYDLVRHHLTEITPEELNYCYLDVMVLSLAIRERLHNHGDNLATIPMTRTGYVRRAVRAVMQQDKAAMRLVRSLTLTTDDYRQLRRAFRGGFTHAGAYNSFAVCEDVDAYDITSSYPTCMVSERYAMEPLHEVTIESEDDILDYIDRGYFIMFDAEFVNLRDTDPDRPGEGFVYDHYQSSSKSWEIEGEVLDNGRVVSADRLTTTIIGEDFEIFCANYIWDELRVSSVKVAERDYLPRPLIAAIMGYYQDKSILKGVTGQEIAYALAKESINSIYGMCAYDPIKDTITFEPSAGGYRWDTKPADLDGAVDKHNRSKNRFLYYVWGVEVTAYARKNLWQCILAAGEHHIYSDTDSEKCLQCDEVREFVADYNKTITQKIEACLVERGLDPALACPVATEGKHEGKRYPLGVWDYEAHYDKFKTLGAKRYMYSIKGDHDPIHCTVAGIGKKEPWDPKKYDAGDSRPLRLPDYLMTLNPEDPFSEFDSDLEVPAGYTGKLTHTYIDTRKEYDVVDYRGVTAHVVSDSGTHLAPQDYKMSEVLDYLEFVGVSGHRVDP